MTGKWRYVVALLSALMIFQAGFQEPASVTAQEPTGSPAPVESAAPTTEPTPNPDQTPDASPVPGDDGTARAPDAPPVDGAIDPSGEEREDLRTASSRTFEQSDGTFVSQFFTDSVFYQPDGSDDWVPIDLTFRPSERDGAVLSVEASPVKTLLFPAPDPGGFLRVEGSGHVISLGRTLEDNSGTTSAPPVADASGLFVDYADFLPGGISLRVFARDDGFKTFLVLPSRPDTNVFTLRLEAPGLTIADNRDGSFSFVDDAGRVVGELPRPFMLDSSVLETPEGEGRGGGVYSEAVTQTLAHDGEGWLLSLDIDPAFLEAAVYPVYVDPTTTTFPTGSTTAGDTFANSQAPNTNFNTYQRPDSPFYHEQWHGNTPNTSYYNEVYIRFNDLEATLGAALIESAYLQMYPYWQYSHYDWKKSWVERVSADWTAGTLKWNNRPANDLTIGEFTSKEDVWTNWDLEIFVQDVVNGTVPNYGVMIHANSLGNGGWKRFVSRNDSSNLKPKLVVTWSAFAGPSVVAPVSGVGTSSRTLTWSLPAQAVQSKYEAQIATNSTFTAGLVSSGEVAIGTPSHTIPGTVSLVDGQLYYWRVKVKYGNNGIYSGWSNVGSFVYLADPRLGDESFYTRVPFDLRGDWRMSVGVHNGELTLDRHLFEVPSYGPAQSLSLSYSSQELSSAGKFGVGWNSNLTQHLTFPSSSVIQWHRADGGVVTFLLNGSTWTPSAGHYETLTLASGEYTLTHRDQTKFVFESTGSGRLKRITDRFGKSLTMNWAASPVTATDASGRVTQIVIVSNLITSVTDSVGRGWTFGYTSGKLTTITDPAGKATTLAYGTSGLTTVTRLRTDAASVTETISWTVDYASGRVSGVRDPINSTVANTFAYSGPTTTVGLLKEYSGPVRNTWTYTVDSAGRVTAALDPEGYTTSHTFDANSNLTQLVLPIDTSPLTNQTISYTYDAKGNVLTQTTQLTATENVVTAMSHNSTNDLLTRSEADNSSALKLITKYVYDGSGHLTSVNANCTTSGTTPPTTASTCTGAGTQDSSTNLITTYTYTANHQVETETDPRGIVTKHVYDSHGNETSTIQNFVSGQASTHERNVTTTYAYDQASTAGRAGLVTLTTDPVGNTTTYTYGPLSHPTSESLPGDSSIPVLLRSTTYDELGNILTQTDSWTGVTRTTTHVYDKANRETSVTDAAGVESSTGYDAAGNAISSTVGGVSTTRTFDGLGRAITETVAGGTSGHQYDGQGRETQVEDATGVASIRSFDLGGRLVQGILDPAGEALTTTHEYDLVGRETATTGPDGVSSTSTYDRVGRVTSDTEAGATTSHLYDRAGNETSTTAPDGTITTTTLDPLSRATVIVANDVATPTLRTEDVTTTTYFDAAGRTIAVRDEQGISSRSIYNKRGLFMKTIINCTDSGTTPSGDPANCIGAGTHDATTNVSTITEYDGSGAATVVVVAQGIGLPNVTTEYAYDAAGRPQAIRDPRGTVTRREYDANGRVTDTIANCTEDTSNPVPPTSSWWNCDGSTLNDGTWNVVTTRTYDAQGNLASETAPNGRLTTFVYDDAGRVIQRIDNDVSGTPTTDEDISTYYAYDDAGRQSAVREPTADRNTFSVIRYIFDEDGHMVKGIRNCTDSGTNPPSDTAWRTCAGDGTEDADTNLVTEYGYDERGNRVSITEADPSVTSGTSVATVITRYAFDAENRLCGVLQNATAALSSPDPCVSPGSGTGSANVWTSYTYDGMGNLSSMTDGEGHTTTYSYDESARISGITDAVGNTTTYGYDELGRRVSQSARGTGQQPSLVTWQYDAAGRLTIRNAGGQTTTYTYDANGNRTGAGLGSSDISVTYDRLNRPLIVTVAGDSAAATSYEYDLSSPSWTDPSGSYGATLDAFDRPVSLADPVHGATTWSWTYRADGQPASSGAPNGNDTAFAYDDAGMASGKATTNVGGLEVSYDWSRNRAGNILSETGAVLVSSTPTSDPINAVTDYGFDPLGRLVEFTRDSSTTTYGWQAVPNRESVQVGSDPATTFTFDDANRETTSSLGNIDYDSEGRLTARPGQILEWNDLGQLTTVKDASTQSPISSYTYDAIDRLLTVTRGSDTVRFRYVGLTTQAAQVVDVDGQTETVLYSVANAWSGERLFEWNGTTEAFYGTNGHHDVTWTAEANGTVSATLLYDAWGNFVASTGSSLPEFRYQGSWADGQSALSWVVTRWYSPDLGHFISEDSVLGAPESPPSRHLYAYAEGEPVARWDPDGRFWYKMRQGDWVESMAKRYMGVTSRWPVIWNQNRNRLNTRGPGPRPTCVWLENRYLTTLWKRLLRIGDLADQCTPQSRVISGSEDARGFTAAGAYGLDWWMLTRAKLYDVTEQKTAYPRDPDNGDRLRFLVNIQGPNGVAFEELFRGRSTGSRDYFGLFVAVWGNTTNPAAGKGDDDAWTMGQFVFVNDSTPKFSLLAHEYIHVLQWQGMGLIGYSSWYFEEVNRLGGLEAAGSTGPKNRAEAIGYIWQAWMRNYARYGEPYPWTEFK